MTDPTLRRPFPTIRLIGSKRPAAAYFFICALLGLLVWLMLWLALVAGQLGQAHPDNNWVKEAYALKFGVAKQYLGQKKLLVVGGSASMFGLRSPDLERAFDLPTVNLGVNAGLGTYEVPARVDKWIEPGDLVVMPWSTGCCYGTCRVVSPCPGRLSIRNASPLSAKSLLQGLCCP